MKNSLLFSGQGSQYVGMMNSLYENFDKAKQIINSADEILGYKLSEICFNGPIEVLKETRYTQPAIFLHSAVLFELLKSKVEFSAVAGHSVGEYAALYAAGVLSFEDALKLVSKRGNLMFSAGEDLPGTMFAVINLADDKLEALCNELSESGKPNVIVPANYNSPGQIVISGSRDYLRENAQKFKEAGARMVTELVVSGAFHSPLMEPAKKELEKAIENINFSDAKVPVYSNVYAKPLNKGDELKPALINQLTSPVKWAQTLIQMKEDGISSFLEFGPGSVLQGLVKRTLSDVEISGADKFEDLQKF
ncbi:MAG: ACP S-malonyltransferase [Candidatus Kapabacteria bacterium]|nr:ACP S-malonyltransferase [Ignavibacteriota bacterium]MCW5885167.1 ACP S-malonyltransferase [Candidatus Kapabacteria bacterium]